MVQFVASPCISEHNTDLQQIKIKIGCDYNTFQADAQAYRQFDYAVPRRTKFGSEEDPGQ